MKTNQRCKEFWPLSLVLLVTVIGGCAVCGSPLQNQNSVYEELKCRDEITKRNMYVGEVFYRSGECIRVQCYGNLKIWEDKCHVPTLEGNCTVIPPANEFLDYPKCCPLYSCRSYINNHNGNTEETRIYDHVANRKSTYITQVFRGRVENGIPAGGPIRTKFGV